MSEIEELQKDEVEALISIYEGDEAFKQVNPTSYQYKYGVDNDPKSFLLEIVWGATYPNDPPKFNLDTFYNSHIVPKVKQKIISTLDEEASQWLGCGMTYSLFECLKERVEELLEDQPEARQIVEEGADKLESEGAQGGVGASKSKKEQLTKSQKRRQWERTDHEGNRARGWDWVDIVKHLAQTGSKDESGAPPS